MKRSISPFRKSPFTDVLARSAQPKIFALIGTTLLILVIASCQLEGPQADQLDALRPRGGAPAAPAAAVTEPVAGWFTDDPTYVRAVAAAIPAVAEPPVVFEARTDSCAAAGGDVFVRFTLHSPFAVHRINARVSTQNSDDWVSVEVEGAVARFATDAGDRAALLAKICAATAENTVNPHFTTDQRLLDAVQNWARFTAPDCEVTLAPADAAGGRGLGCRLPAADPELARQELVGIRTAMIRGWSRQPYLLTRRVALGIELADALGPAPGADSERRLDTVCKILDASLPAEMPAILASSRWQSVACHGSGPARRQAALFGLAKTVGEIDFLRQVFERTAKLGMLSIHLPAPQGPGEKFLVSLTPQIDVVDNLSSTTAHLLAADGGKDAQTCWHPLFAEKPELLRLARQLAIAGEVTNVDCGTQSLGPDQAVNRYFAESIASETEFVLQNGQSKTLRIPVGNYAYVIRSLPASTEDWDDVAQSAPSSKGVVHWDEKRPRASIATW